MQLSDVEIRKARHLAELLEFDQTVFPMMAPFAIVDSYSFFQMVATIRFCYHHPEWLQSIGQTVIDAEGQNQAILNILNEIEKAMLTVMEMIQEHSDEIEKEQ